MTRKITRLLDILIHESSWTLRLPERIKIKAYIIKSAWQSAKRRWSHNGPKVMPWWYLGKNEIVISMEITTESPHIHDEVKWKHRPRHWPFVRGIHRSQENSPHKGQLRVAMMFSLICAWTNGPATNRDAVDLRRHRAHNDGTLMLRIHAIRSLTHTA